MSKNNQSANRVGDDREQRLLVAGCSAGDRPHMIADIDARIVDPEGPAASEDVHQPLASERTNGDLWPAELGP